MMVLIKWDEALVAFLVKFAAPRSEASFTIYESNQCFVQTKGRSITTVRANVTTVSTNFRLLFQNTETENLN